MRRLMFWWHVVNLDKKELLNKFYRAQNINRSKDDWVYQIDKDKKELNLELTDEEIKTFKKEQFRKMIKLKIERNAAKYLEERRRAHSKSKNIKFRGFSPAKYLLSKKLSTEEVQTLFKLRTRMIDVKENFKSANRNNMWCKTSHLFTETQQHLIDCPELRLN